MLRLTRRVWRKRMSKSHQAVSSLSTPNVRRPWSDLSNMTAAEKEEVLHGSWREARPIELRRTAHGPPAEAAAGTGATAPAPSAAAEPPLAFSTDEEVVRYLQEEDEDEQQELAFPTLTLAQQFFTDLAETADEELEEGGGGAPPKSDEARAEENRDVHRHFFADYYRQQQMVAEEDRFSFIDLMTRPGAAAFEVNSERPLSRLTVRDQLERHYSRRSCLEPSFFSPCVVLLAQAPTQPLGAAPRVPYTAATSPLARQEALEAEREGPDRQVESHPTPALPHQEEEREVDLLSDLLQDDVSLIAPVPSCAKTTALAAAEAAAPPPPISLDHLYWLQRQVASGSLIPTDLLACIVARLATAAAVAYTNGREDVVPLVLDLTAASQSESKTDWSADVAQYARTAAPQKDIVVAVAGTRTSPQRRDEGDKDGVDERARAGAVRETAVNLLYVSPTQRHRPWSLFPREAQTPCAVVLCAPETTEDGVRPQFLFGDSDPASVMERLPVNQYVSVAQTLAERFGHERKALQGALEAAAQTAHASPGGAEDGAPPNTGFVLYCTRSMNPVENEAVVCAVLHHLAQRSRRPLHVDCVAVRRPAEATATATSLRSAVPDDLGALLSHGQPGLTTWCGVEGGPEEMEASTYPEALRQRVAAASWRSLPHVCPQDDGAYCILLRVRAQNAALPPPTSLQMMKEKEDDDDEGASMVPCVVTGVATPHQHADGGVQHVRTVHTQSLYDAVQRCRDFQCTVGGVAVGYWGRATGRCELSSAVSSPAVLHALTTAFPLLPLSCPLHVLATLLREGKWCGPPSVEPSWRDTLGASVTVPSPVTVLLRPAVPAAALPDGQALHPALQEELSAVGVVAEATVDVRRARVGLRLRVPDTMPDAPRQREALRELCVGLRDALLYVERRLGIAETAETSVRPTVQPDEATMMGAPPPGAEPIAWEEGDFDVLSASPPKATPSPAAPPARGAQPHAEAVDVFSREAETSVANFMAQLEKERGQARPQDWSRYAPRPRGGKRW